MLRLSRPLHQVPRGGARFNSTASSNQQKAQDALKKATEESQAVMKKGKEMWEKVDLTKAQAAVEKVVTKERIDAVTGPLKKYSEKVVGLLGPQVQAVLPPLRYQISTYSHVAKLVYKGESLAPPTSLSQITSAWKTLANNAVSKTFWQNTVRDGDLLRLGILGLEAYGLFKVGEIIGRRSLVGYSVPPTGH